MLLEASRVLFKCTVKVEVDCLATDLHVRQPERGRQCMSICITPQTKTHLVALPSSPVSLRYSSVYDIFLCWWFLMQQSFIEMNNHFII